jgi:hypothetical protein
MAAAGCRVIGIDPVTAASTSEKSWIDDLRFLMTVKSIVREYGASLVLVTHPRKGRRPTSSLDDLAGGAAYPRFSQTVMWIRRLDKDKSVLVAGPCGNFTTQINRSIRLSKTRNGRGAGVELGYVFDGKTLRFSEQGAVLKNKPAGDVKDEIREASEETNRDG